MRISLIVAMDKNRGIGKGNILPWGGMVPRDMARFKELTMGKPVIMGRNTFKSIGHALPERMNIVLTHDTQWGAKNVWCAGDLESGLRLAHENALLSSEALIIGGAQIFREALPLVTRIYLTEIDGSFSCDTFFPEYDPLEWRQSSLIVHHADLRNQYKLRFHTLERQNAH